nr:MlaE family lipid ABC transporter permease subunit [uncultured Roseateles sp.]
MQPAALTAKDGGAWALSGSWTVGGLGNWPAQLQTLACNSGPLVLDGQQLEAMDSAGAWVLQRWLLSHGASAQAQHWPPRLLALLERVAGHAAAPLLQPPRHGLLERTGRSATAAGEQAWALLHFIGETAVATLGLLRHPQRMRWRSLLRQIEIDGFDALPIIGLTAFLIGIVVAYQGADQLRHYGANIFVVDLVGYAMLREFAPLITAIIIAGRSGSAYAAQIGTMVVTEEVDAMRTLDIAPIELLVLPKLLALAVALPLLTVFADIAGVFGGMVMARSQLGIGFHEFLARFSTEMQGPTLLIGIGKSWVFAVIIVLVGCFQGFRTRGSADSVGRQTTLSVVQGIFLVIVADALFSVVFNLLGI